MYAPTGRDFFFFRVTYASGALCVCTSSPVRMHIACGESNGSLPLSNEVSFLVPIGVGVKMPAKRIPSVCAVCACARVR